MLIEMKRVASVNPWTPPHARSSRFGGLVAPQKKEHRRPLYWLSLESDGELYFINSSKTTLDEVAPQSGSFQTIEDQAFGSVSQPNTYKNVQPNEAVLIEKFDNFYDLDLVFQISLKVICCETGNLNFLCPPSKGNVRETVLLWDTRELGKRVRLIESTID